MVSGAPKLNEPCDYALDLPEDYDDPDSDFRERSLRKYSSLWNHEHDGLGFGGWGFAVLQCEFDADHEGVFDRDKSW